MTENKEVEPYMEMDVKDENQILAEMKGEFLSAYVYSFIQGGRTITNLSYAGVKEAIRRRGHFQILEQHVEEVNGKIRALVKIHDLVNDIDVLGASEAEADKAFAYVLAVNKAERNAYSKLIPAKFFAELIAEKLGKSSTPFKRVEPVEKPKDVSPKSEQPQEQPTDQVPVSYQLNSWIAPETYAKLSIDEKEGNIILKPKERLETEAFKLVCAAVEHFHGKWVGVDGVWVIPNA